MSKKVSNPKDDPDGPSKREEATEVTLIASEYAWTDERETFVADSGATSHITPYKDILHNYVELEVPKEVHTGGSSRFAKGFGEYLFESEGKEGKLARVLYVPGFPINVFSLMTILSLGHNVVMNGKRKTIEVKDEGANTSPFPRPFPGRFRRARLLPK